MQTFALPDLGEGLEEAEIVSWHVAVGDQVVRDQPLVSVETDKAVVDIPAPYTGRVAALHAEAGALVKVGAPLADFDDQARPDTGVIVGELPRDEEAAAAPAAAQARGVRAAPAVRALAKRLGVDLATVAPSGPNNSVTAEDVNRAAKGLAGTATAEPLRGPLRAMAQRMAAAHRQVAPTSVVDTADIESWPAGSDVTVRLIRAMVAACRAAPALNCWYDGEALTRQVLARIDVGIAVDTEDGLFVPVLRDVANRSAADLRRGLDALRKDVQARRIPPEELRGATVTLSNFGVFGAGRFAALVVIPPQVAIVGAGLIRPEPRVVDGKIVARRILPLSLTFDHRAVTGGEATRFLAAMIKDLTQAK